VIGGAPPADAITGGPAATPPATGAGGAEGSGIELVGAPIPAPVAPGVTLGSAEGGRGAPNPGSGLVVPPGGAEAIPPALAIGACAFDFKVRSWLVMKVTA
jgi:hypothetical protein